VGGGSLPMVPMIAVVAGAVVIIAVVLKKKS